MFISTKVIPYASVNISVPTDTFYILAHSDIFSDIVSIHNFLICLINYTCIVIISSFLCPSAKTFICQNDQVYFVSFETHHDPSFWIYTHLSDIYMQILRARLSGLESTGYGLGTLCFRIEKHTRMCTLLCQQIPTMQDVC